MPFVRFFELFLSPAAPYTDAGPYKGNQDAIALCAMAQWLVFAAASLPMTASMALARKRSCGIGTAPL